MLVFVKPLYQNMTGYLIEDDPQLRDFDICVYPHSLYFIQCLTINDR